MDKLATLNTTHLSVAQVPEHNQLAEQGWSYIALLQLHQRLQSTLILSRLLDNYLRWLAEYLPVSGLEFCPGSGKENISCGRQPRQHRLHYVLNLEQCCLGDMTFYPKQRLPEEQLAMIEQSLGVLAPVLNNSLDYAKLEQLAFHDGLTQVMNRTALQSLLPKEVSRAERYQYPLSVAMTDMDYFKPINDLLGHAGGDLVLREVARVITSKLRDSDLCFRYGGDEFLLIFPATEYAGARYAVQQIRNSLKQMVIEAEGEQVTPSFSVGVASYCAGDSAEDLIRRADLAMYAAKQTGRPN